MKRYLFIFTLLALCLQGFCQSNKVVTKPNTVKTNTAGQSKNTAAVKPKTTTKPTTATTKANTTAKTNTATKTNGNTATKTNTTVKTNTAKTSSAATGTTAKTENTAAKQPAQTAPQASPTCGYLCNPPLPYMPSKLDILFIGNSYSIDTSTALPEIFNSIGIRNVNVYVLYKGGCSMKQHYNYYKSGEKVYELHLFNYQGEQLLDKAISINEVMRKVGYDIVVFQQYSLESGDYSTYEPYLSKLIQAYNITKISPRTTYAFNETWAYSSKNKNIAKYKTPQNMWKSICSSVKKMKAETGIDVIIPVGTAVQNARNASNLQIQGELTRDDLHLDLYMGRYLAACTFFEAIIAPCMGKNIRDDFTIYGKNGDPSQVNNSNRRILQNCARLAIANNYEISEFVDE